GSQEDKNTDLKGSIRNKYSVTLEVHLKDASGRVEHAGNRDQAVSIFVVGNHSNLDTLLRACVQLLKKIRPVYAVAYLLKRSH
ncbi:unnamed protein product, partial [Pylaiella littoralis]